jgi:hypothetical protein
MYSTSKTLVLSAVLALFLAGSASAQTAPAACSAGVKAKYARAVLGREKAKFLLASAESNLALEQEFRAQISAKYEQDKAAALAAADEATDAKLESTFTRHKAKLDNASKRAIASRQKSVDKAKKVAEKAAAAKVPTLDCTL